MYLHLGQDTVIDDKSIVAMFDIDACTVSKKTRDFLKSGQGKKPTQNIWELASYLNLKPLIQNLLT